MAEGATIANAFVQIMPSMEGATSSITQAIVPGLSDAGGKAGLDFGNMFKGKLAPVMKIAGAAMAGMFAASFIADSYQAVEAGMNNVKQATGATGDAAKELEAVYLDVASSVSGSFEDIGSAVGELNTRLGLTGDELEAASEAAMKYAKVTGQDATSAIQDVTRMMNDAGISADEYAEYLDKLIVAGQASGADLGKLTESVTANSATFKELGFSTDEAIAMLAQFEVSGANTSAVLAGMKKGVAEWASEGLSAKDGFTQFVQGVQDGTVTAQDAIELFGSRSGMALYDAAQKGQLDFADMYATITEGSEGALDDIYNDTLTVGEKMDILGKNLQTGIFEVVTPLLEALMPAIDAVLELLKEVINVATAVLVPAMEVVGTVISGIAELVAMMPDIISEGISEAVEWFTQLQEGISEAVETASGNVQYAFEWISNVVSSVVSGVSAFVSSGFNTVRSVISGIMSGIQSVISSVWNTIRSVIQGAVSAISGVINGLSGIVSTVTNIFNKVKEAITNPIETARNTIQGAIDKIKSIINGAKLQLPKFKLPHFNIYGGKLPWGIGGMGVKPSISVSWYAKGGMVDGATLIGAGESGPELIWPSYDPYLSKYADAIAEKIDHGGVTVNFTYNGEGDATEAVRLLTRNMRQLQMTGAF